MQSPDTHIFAFFFNHLSDKIKEIPAQPAIISLQNEDLLHRITHVLKMKHSDSCIFFDKTIHVTGMIQSISKKEIQFLVEKITKTVPFLPHIILYLPLLKRTHLEEAVYFATECGVSEIQFISTQKSQHHLSDHEIKRLEKISISACEQAKYFIIPRIYAPRAMTEILSRQKKDNSVRIYFDSSGIPLPKIISGISDIQEKTYELMIGPEGGLTQNEIEFLYNHQFISCALTLTILRAKTAAGIGIAFLRSLQ